MVVSGSRRDFDDRSDFTGDQPTAQTGDIFASDRSRNVASSRRSSPGVADSRSPQSVAGGPASAPRQLASVLGFEHELASDPNAGRDNCAGFLPGRVTQQRSPPTSRAFYWRRVLNRQNIVDLDDAGRSELPFVGGPLKEKASRIVTNEVIFVVTALSMLGLHSRRPPPPCGRHQVVYRRSDARRRFGLSAGGNLALGGSFLSSPSSRIRNGCTYGRRQCTKQRCHGP